MTPVIHHWRYAALALLHPDLYPEYEAASNHRYAYPRPASSVSSYSRVNRWQDYDHVIFTMLVDLDYIIVMYSFRDTDAEEDEEEGE